MVSEHCKDFRKCNWALEGDGLKKLKSKTEKWKVD